jgi:hypothetical protein
LLLLHVHEENYISSIPTVTFFSSPKLFISVTENKGWFRAEEKIDIIDQSTFLTEAPIIDKH